MLKIENPILTDTDLLKIKAMDVPGFKVETLSICYYKNTDLEKAIDRLFVDVDRAYRDGANILILSDRDIDEYHVAIPSLLAGGRCQQVPGAHPQAHGRGARSWKAASRATCTTSPPCWATAPAADQPLSGAGDASAASSVRGCWTRTTTPPSKITTKPCWQGIVKIASKMGISTIQSYAGQPDLRGAGHLSQEVSRPVLHQYRLPRGRHHHGTISRATWKPAISEAFDPLGLDIDHDAAQPGRATSSAAAARRGSTCTTRRPSTCCSRPCWTGNYDTFQAVHRRWSTTRRDAAMHLRSLLDFNYPEVGVPLDEVEPAWTPS